MKGKEIDNRSSEVQFLDQIINLVSFFQPMVKKLVFGIASFNKIIKNIVAN